MSISVLERFGAEHDPEWAETDGRVATGRTRLRDRLTIEESLAGRLSAC